MTSPMMDRAYILAEIKRTANANGGKPLGRDRFLRETGIKQTDWIGRYWVRWGDALQEAGYEPNQLQVAYSAETLFEHYIGLVRELGRLPVNAELRMKEHHDKTFPSHGAFARFGPKQQLIERLQKYCEARSGYDDIVTLCARSSGRTTDSNKTRNRDAEREMGFVYLIRSGRYYKIGRSNAVGRRERELAIQLPEKANTVHAIRTDDPLGIEAYWHHRFEARRKNGEWFELSSSDLSAFRRRKFM
jgi:hypothetical protein